MSIDIDKSEEDLLQEVRSDLVGADIQDVIKMVEILKLDFVEEYFSKNSSNEGCKDHYFELYEMMINGLNMYVAENSSWSSIITGAATNLLSSWYK